MKTTIQIIIFLILLICHQQGFAQNNATAEDAKEIEGMIEAQEIVDAVETDEIEPEENETSPNPVKITKPNQTIFDDHMLLKGYSQKYEDHSKEILLEMIKDNTLSSFKSAAAVRVFRNRFGEEVVSKEKKQIEKFLLRRLNRTTSPYVQVEIMYTLDYLDRYKYFKSMTPALIQKLDHYNETVNELAFEYLEEIIETSNYRAREARVVFTTLRKMLFLTRKRLAKIETPDARLSRKLKLVRWSIKVLGNQQLKKLPKEVLGLL